jgi:hypothetical protein
MIFVAINRQIPSAVDDNVISDDDFGLSDDRPSAVAGEEVRTPALTNSIANALLGAWECPDWSADSGEALALGAGGAVSDRRGFACAPDTPVFGAFVLVVAVLFDLAFWRVDDQVIELCF